MEVLGSRVLLRPADPERTTAFYRDTLGLAVYREYPGGTVFFLGQSLLEVAGHGEPGEPPTTHTVLWVQVRDIVATFAEFAERGVNVLREPMCEPWGLVEGWIADPDGLRLVIVQVPEDHPLRTDVRSPGRSPTLDEGRQHRGDGEPGDGKHRLQHRPGLQGVGHGEPEVAGDDPEPAVVDVRGDDRTR
jgi:catechol 2,3-dioxygenase-like lactoylglutathione lyase family enzyme